MTANRTKDSALAVLIEGLPAVRKSVEVDAVRESLSEDLVKEVFEQAWLHQFDENRSDFRGLVRDLVQEALGRSSEGRSK